MSDLEDAFAFQLRALSITGWEREVVFALPRKWRLDFAWSDRKLAVEIDGATWISGRHNRGAGVESDSEKYSTAAVLGWRVLRLTRAMVEDGRGLKLLQEALDG